MPKETIKIPKNNQAHEIDLVYLQSWDGGSPMPASAYLQMVRIKDPNADYFRTNYERYLPQLCAELADQVLEADFDLLITAPSSRRDAERFRDEIAGRIKILDISGSFCKTKTFKAGLSKSLDEVRANIFYNGTKDLTNVKSVLIIDDVFGEGKTVAIIIELLHRNGLPKNTSITVGCALKIIHSTPPPAPKTGHSASLESFDTSLPYNS